MATSADAVVTSRPGTTCTSGSGRNRSMSTPTGTTAMRSGSTLWSSTMSLNEFSDTVMIRCRRRATCVCMSTKEYQRRRVSFLYQLVGGLDLEAPVDRDRVVDRAEHRDAELALDEEQAVAEALVVLDDVELVLAVAEVVPGPHREGQGLGEGAADEGGDLEDVLPVLQLPDPGLPHREVVVVDVEAGQLDQRDPLVEDRVRLAAEHLDVVAEVDEGLREVPGVDPLAAHVGLAPVGEVGDPEGGVARPWTAKPFGRLTHRSSRGSGPAATLNAISHSDGSGSRRSWRRCPGCCRGGPGGSPRCPCPARGRAGPGAACCTAAWA